jgi:hypothetical protein
MLNKGMARLAGVVSLLLVGLAGAAIVWHLAAGGQADANMRTLAVLELAFLVVMAAAGVQLVRCRAWAQGFLLVVWLAALVTVVATGASALLWGVPSWWTLPWPMAGVLIPAAALEVLAIALLMLASHPQSRLRYSTNVALAVAAAVALVVAANMFAQDRYVRKDVESLGRYSLSPRATQIVDAVDQPVRLTCVYTALGTSEERRLTDEQRGRVMDLLRDMSEHNKLVKYDIATTDVQRAELVSRLRDKLAAGAARHDEFLKQFLSDSDAMIAAFNAYGEQWEGVADKGYLAQWGLASDVAKLMSQEAQQFDKLREKVSSGLSGTDIPNYSGLAGDVTGELKTAGDNLDDVSGKIKLLMAIPKAVKANRDAALAKADEAVRAVDAIAAVLPGADQQAADPAAVLRQVADASDAASKKLQATTVALKEIAGADDQSVSIVNASQAWMAKAGGRQITMPGGMVLRERNTITDLCSTLAATVTRFKVEINATLEAANADYQAKTLADLPRTVEGIRASVANMRTEAAAAMNALSDVDDATAGLMEGAADGKAFEDVTGPMAELTKQADALGKLESGTLAQDITGKNIVIVETDDATRVVDYESTWPLKVKASDQAREAKQERVFNGDAAVSSKILSMTNEPFAAVLITYYKPEVSREMERMFSQSGLSPDKFSTLKDLLTAANFEVGEWNLKDPRPAGTEGRPQVLLVLPPPEIPPMAPSGQARPEPFGQEHLDRLTAAVDDGTPAIFVAEWNPPQAYGPFMPPVTPPYHYGDYLSNGWGIDVLSDDLILAGVPDPEQPRKVRIDPTKMLWFPLSSFTNHVIGEPLQGQRMLWYRMAIVKPDENVPAGVDITPLLTIDQTMKNVWASNRLDEMTSEFQSSEGSYLSPAYDKGDTAVPFDVAVVATHAGTDRIKPGRIVVLGLAAGLRDGYIDQRPQELNADGGIYLSDPPKANADVVVNSVCWLIGRDQYISRGPARIKPIRSVEPSVAGALQWAGIVGLPVLVLAIGGLVLLMRRN